MSAKVLGIGGVFVKARDPEALRAWYRDMLGFDVQAWGGAMFQLPNQPQVHETTGAILPVRATAKPPVAVWNPFPADTTYFEPSQKSFMINLRVDDLLGMLAHLRASGANVLERRGESEGDEFGYVIDPEGVLIELWQQAPAP